jgi:hypothetical protein
MESKKENKMRALAAAAMVVMASTAMADEIDDAHRLALQGRDSYWNCLARAYSQDNIKRMSEQDFTRDIASVCPSERQNFRVTLVDYLSMQFPQRRCRSPSDDGQQGDRIGAEGYRHRVRPAQVAEIGDVFRLRRPIPAIRFSVISIDIWRGIVADDVRVGSGHFSGDHRIGGVGGRDRIWADRAVRKAHQAGPAAGPGGACGTAGARDKGRAQLVNAKDWTDTVLQNTGSVPI